MNSRDWRKSPGPSTWWDHYLVDGVTWREREHENAQEYRRILSAFEQFLADEGWDLVEEARYPYDLVARRGDEQLIAEIKAGPRVDLRDAIRQLITFSDVVTVPSTTLAVVVPEGSMSTFPLLGLTRLKIYEVTDLGDVHQVTDQKA